LLAGIVPGVILIVFLGVFALYTSKLLIDFKANHPSVHNMGIYGSMLSSTTDSHLRTGDAGYIMFGPIGREILSGGTIIFAIAATASLIVHTTSTMLTFV
jgi:hypothetical protein